MKAVRCLKAFRNGNTSSLSSITCQSTILRSDRNKIQKRFRNPAMGGGYLGSGHRPVKSSRRVLVTGAAGQIGSELVGYLRGILGSDNVIASDVKSVPAIAQDGPFVYADVTNYDMLARVVLESGTDTLVHLAALLSAVAERNTRLAINVNNKGLENCLELCRNNNLSIYAPSSIAVFGDSTPKDNTPDETVMRPSTIYGITKVYNELLGEYYFRTYGVDFRSLRYPGIISNATMPGGGTTDYAVEIYYDALKKGSYKCFLEKDTMMPMLYMPDCLRATAELIMADSSLLTQRVYNVTGMSFTPEGIAAEIKKEIPEFTIDYKPDFRQQIANTWPRTIDDSIASRDWGWKPEFDLESMTHDMLTTLKTKV